MTKHHFHTFDALRFFAFLKVFLLHLPIYAFPWFNFIKVGGGIGVQFFFVLSGFLISYLILQEKVETNSFNLKNFFIRRVLRIWPLYFLMVGFAYATPLILNYFNIQYSNTGYEPDWKYSLFFLENYKSIIENGHANVSPLVVMWSLCIEEHFYIVWGLLLYFLPLNAFPKIAFGSMALANICRKFFIDHHLLTADLLTNLDLFAAGGLLAFILVTRKDLIEEKINSISNGIKWIFICFFISIVCCSPYIFNNYFGEIFQPTILGLLFTMLLAVFIPSMSKLKVGDKNILSRWGRLSYGFYLFHTIVINLFLKIFTAKGFFLTNPLYAIIFIVVSFGISWLCSEVSFLIIEKPFLNLKKYFYSKKISFGLHSK